MLTSTRSKKDSAATISLSDFMRIRNTIIPPSNEEDERKGTDSVLKATSQQRMRNWPDSIEMAKKNQLESRKKVFFEKEIEKRKIDDEEKRYQEMQKKLVIEKANKLMFDAQDPVKSFHSKLLMADVLKEREYQKEIIERKKEIEVTREIKWREMEQDKQREFDMKELMKAQDEKMKKQQQMNIINQQFTDFKIKKVKEYQDRVVEGEIIKQSARQAVEQEKHKEEDRKLKAIEQQSQFKLANAELEKLKDVKRQKEKLEEKKIEEFALKKQQMTDMRKRKEQEKIKEKQDLRQKLIEKQIEYLKNLKSREDEILDKQVKEAEEKKHKELLEKQRRITELKAQIEEDREHQFKRKKDIKEQGKKEDKEFVDLWKERMKLLVYLICF
jgi:hypothetical protein